MIARLAVLAHVRADNLTRIAGINAVRSLRLRRAGTLKRLRIFVCAMRFSIRIRYFARARKRVHGGEKS